MFRTLCLLLLAAAAVATAAAQTTPATTTTKTTTATKTTRQAPVKRKATRTTTKKTAANTTMRPQEQPVTDGTTSGRRYTGTPASADGKGQGVYAAPGMAIDVTPPSEVGDARGDAPKTAPRQGNTLTPSPRK